jgi:cell division protein FtsB
MNPNSDEVMLIMMIENLERRIEDLKKKNEKLKELLDILFKLNKDLKTSEDK